MCIEWTDEELRILLTYSWMGAKELNDTHLKSDRTIPAIKCKLGKVRAYKMKKWSSEEDDVIKAFYRQDGRNITRRFTKASDKDGFDCRMRAVELGI